MKPSHLYALTLSLFIAAVARSKQQSFSPTNDIFSNHIPDDPVARTIVSRALADGIDLAAFAFSGPALQEIVRWSHFEVSSELPDSLLQNLEGATKIDVHVHYAPNWYGDIRQDPTEWNLEEHLELMANQSIEESIFSVPNPNIFLGDEGATLAIARLLNENMAALAKALPLRFKFFATIPLPYVHASITEAQYALESLGALGVALSSNHEGHYLGDRLFTPFFSALQNTIIFLHPNEPLLEVNKTFVKANPTAYSPVIAEFYFETARTILDLALSQTLTNYTSLDFIMPHLGGAFPAIIDRSMAPGALLDDVMAALRTRCWWDSAGFTYSHQLGGLLAYNISPSFLLYGSDYPYISPSLVDASANAMAKSPFLDEEEKQKPNKHLDEGPTKLNQFHMYRASMRIPPIFDRRRFFRCFLRCTGFILPLQNTL
ncbi:Amidohydro-rel domain-containing protein [Mycena venus]|uniref:Amidohydro-rel domain-containing protein n=1 Tax=Mycena venus TaxID=2733690 RepID=A0A8H6YV09_9AGAR|nr:Amidohydro-rel domain-containing protein [Mycena venus]